MNFLMKLLTAVPEADAVSKLVFEPKQFINMLSYMGKGMLVIFVLIGVIILVTMIINKVFSDKQK